MPCDTVQWPCGSWAVGQLDLPSENEQLNQPVQCPTDQAACNQSDKKATILSHRASNIGPNGQVAKECGREQSIMTSMNVAGGEQASSLSRSRFSTTRRGDNIEGMHKRRASSFNPNKGVARASAFRQLEHVPRQLQSRTRRSVSWAKSCKNLSTCAKMGAKDDAVAQAGVSGRKLATRNPVSDLDSLVNQNYNWGAGCASNCDKTHLLRTLFSACAGGTHTQLRCCCCWCRKAAQTLGPVERCGPPAHSRLMCTEISF